MSDDVKVSQRVKDKYRELSTEEPPRALDDAILAAAREAQRPWTRRYAVPLGLAAVLVLSVTVTLRIQHEQPGIEVPVPVAKVPAPTEVAQADMQLKLKAEDQIKPPVPERRAKAELRDRARQDEPRPFAQPMGEQARESVAAASPPAAKRADVAAVSAPEKELERIALLRREGKHDDADKALAEFRKRLPDYNISEAMRERVERR